MEFLKDYHCRILYLDSLNPYLNLAYEEFLFQQLKEKEYIFLLYKCSPSLIMGRFQNPWQEVNTSKLTQSPIPLIRRISGGGTVYHDEGNLNYSFLSFTDNWKQKEHCLFILEALKEFHIVGKVTDKFDILVDTADGSKKISGSAFKKSRQKHLHHGTLLIEANLKNLREYLAKTSKKITSKAIPSRPHSVINLKQLNERIDIATIVKQLEKNFQQAAREDISIEIIAEQEMILKASERSKILSSWESTWGEAPRFTQDVDYSFPWSSGTFQFLIEKGRVLEIVWDDGYFHPDIVDKINQEAHRLKFNAFDISNAFQKLASTDEVYGEQILEIAHFLEQELH